MTSTTISQESVMKGTGKSLADWFDYLDGMQAEQLAHKEIASILQEKKAVSGWWAQTITVEYERKIGRRVVGQNCEGDFQAAVSKTLRGPLDRTFLEWQEFVREQTHFNQIIFSNSPTSSKTEKWRYWRVGLRDGSRISVILHQKNSQKVQLAVNHEKLADAKTVEHWRAYWKTRIQEFQQLLS